MVTRPSQHERWCIQLATFDAGEKTHRRVLPQPAALESVSADNPRGRDETGHRGRKAAGVGHGRGETSRSAPSARRHPESAQAGEGAGRETHARVFVLDRHGRPLQPCHSARARELLRRDRAVVVRHTPFVIRLRDRTVDVSVVDGVEIGIDPGSKTTGMAVFAVTNRVRRGLFALELEHRGARIRDKLVQRSNYRKRRRTKNLRYRSPRFANRARPAGWLPPSLVHRVVTTNSWVTRLRRWAPVAAVHVERVAFDTQLIQRPEVDGVEYQQGTLAGFEVREYLLAKWARRCAYCGKTDVPLNIDHVRPRSRGGSDRVSNLTLACVPCNQSKGARSVEEFLAGRPAVLRRVLAQLKLPLRDAAAVSSTRWALWRALVAAGLRVSTASGGRTKWNRTRSRLAKTHALDALCVGEVDGVLSYPTITLTASATGRGSYCRTRTDKFGFPRIRLPRVKSYHGYQTGDFVRAVIPAGRKTGAHIGRVVVKASGYFAVRTRDGLVSSVHYRHIRLLQRADGYRYTRC